MARISRKKGNVNQTGTDVKDIFRTAVYLRLSVEDNGKKDADSLDNQRELLLSYVADRPYLELIEIYEDNGWTVYTDDDGLSAQVEYMVLVKEKSVEVLTK